MLDWLKEKPRPVKFNKLYLNKEKILELGNIPEKKVVENDLTAF